ncbi:gamma-glutamyltransferase [Staphylococcus caledonicus]|uniref:gamma-glutamyltransferase n=1 Tax=Staphylococcus caledonicus TaxID=2741333 RepID=UPI0018E4A75A|nr:gamma-glutamyltransferase [Staphylococcus caledonicus]MBI5973117.1 gamma-glutamyltransferase [Staphylococcus caledonicus]
MNIYNKGTLSVILIMTILISFTFYYFNKEDKPDKDTLFENKIANHKASGSKKKYGVASNNTIATRVGNKIIEDGGNAVDAAMGVSYALAVTEPHSSGIGGGGATLTYNGKDGEEPKMYEYKTMSSFNYKKGDEIGTPGFVQGLHDMHQREGKMDEKKILNYVIPLAKNGFEVDSELERSMKLFGSDIDRDSPFFKGKRTVREGDVVKQEALAKTLENIRDKGPSYFYKDIAKSVSKQIDDELTEEDFKAVKTEEKQPVSTNYLNNKIYSASNPLGGTLMLQGLKIDESVNSGGNTSEARNDYISGIIKSRDVMYRNRDIVNGQEPSSDTYLSQDYLLDNLNNINSGETSSNFDPTLSTTSTTHFVVIDKQGKLASTTNTLSSFFGSGKFVKQGFYMNNSLTNFSSDPNSPNYGGKHKAPRSYTSPSIVVGPDFYMGIGTPGGNKIPTLLNEVLIDYLRNDGTLQESINKPRFYNDGGTVYYENATSDEDINIFKSMGYGVEEKRNDPNFGSVQGAIYNKNDQTVEIGHDVGNR